MLDVVDTPGIDCESFPRYYKQGDGFMIVYAVDNIITFEEAKNHCVNLLKSKQGIDVPIIIIANKWDYEDQRWVISRQQGQDLAAAFNAKYFETSAASSIGITEAFAAMVRMLRETKQPPVPNENNQKCIVF
ncbi:putative ras-1 [Histomonas meleagridis]|uniref:putative ras-1 n=1 Tax=Histomonas meleagridis TaxID=135588 RepID=UPI0035596A92|nr:putative ras-1 [Histomonas meleagridis]KAH0800310.1 putative ras-1 [Histomonas meleagridis]